MSKRIQLSMTHQKKAFEEYKRLNEALKKSTEKDIYDAAKILLKLRL
jgi:hypothetical protein